MGSFGDCCRKTDTVLNRRSLEHLTFGIAPFGVSLENGSNDTEYNEWKYSLLGRVDKLRRHRNPLTHKATVEDVLKLRFYAQRLLLPIQKFTQMPWIGSRTAHSFLRRMREGFCLASGLLRSRTRCDIAGYFKRKFWHSVPLENLSVSSRHSFPVWPTFYCHLPSSFFSCLMSEALRHEREKHMPTSSKL